ncbi:MAG: MFS transporter [Dehalococcoidia bacterium]|nr:MFS transporter [Dehalococcoidia bacterium]
MSTEPRTTPKRFSALRHRNFMLLWVGSVISNSGSWMQIVAQGWLVYDLTHSAFQLGLVSMARAVPMIVLPPLGGVVADRMPRLRLMKVSQAASAIAALALAVLVGQRMAGVPELVLFSVISGVIAAFDAPTRQAVLPDLVPPEDVASAVALNSASWQGAAMVGPALAGVLVGLIGIAGAFYANAASFLAVVFALYLMRDVPERSRPRGSAGFVTDFFDGLRLVRRTPVLWTLLLLATVTSLFGRAYQQLLPVFAGEVLDVGATGLGLMLAAPGLGTVIGAVVLGYLGDVERKGLVQVVGMVLFSGLLLLFTLSSNFPVSLGLLTLMGACFLVLTSMNTTMLQLSAPPAMRGRIMSYLTVIMQGFAPLGAVLAGGAGVVIGTPTAVAISALVVAAAALLSVPLAPVVFRYSGRRTQGARSG